MNAGRAGAKTAVAVWGVSPAGGGRPTTVYPATMEEQRTAALGDGVIAGAIAFAVFVAFFATTNIVAGRSAFHTAHQLGTALFGFGDPGAGAQAGPVLAYSLLHFIAALTIGVVTSLLFLEVELQPALWYIVMFIFIAGLLYSVAVGGIVANEIAGAVSWTEVVIANVIAGLISGAYLWRRHPKLKDRVRRAG